MSSIKNVNKEIDATLTNICTVILNTGSKTQYFSKYLKNKNWNDIKLRLDLVVFA